MEGDLSSPPPVVISIAADDDLFDIGLYLRAVNRTAAEDFLQRVSKTLDLISRFPEMGRLRDELAIGLRSFVVDRYVLFYTIGPGGRPTLVRVIHGMRDLPSIFSPDRPSKN